MKPLQHAQISQKTHGGTWRDYIEIHNFLDSSKATCAHFKHRFLLHHAEGIELATQLFGEQIKNSEGQIVSIRRILTDHLIEDVGSIISVEDWAQDLMPQNDAPFYQFLAKKRGQIEAGEIKGEKELLNAFNLADKDVCAVKSFLDFPLQNSAHPAAVLFSHNSFAVFLAEKLLGVAFFKKNSKSNCKTPENHLVATREVFERLIFLRIKIIYSPAEIISRTAENFWMRGSESSLAQAEKKRLAKLETVRNNQLKSAFLENRKL